MNNSDLIGTNDDDVNDSPYSKLKLSCSYMDETQFVTKFSNRKKFSYLSWNIQSLPAKFNEFQEFINVLSHNNCSPDVICLQETWKIIDKNLFALPNYSLPETLQRSNSQGGGVGFYFKNNVKFNILKEKCIFVDRVIETIFAEVWSSDNKKTIVGSVYRPATAHPTLSSSDQFSQFFEIFSNILNDLSSMNLQITLFGDFNLDALKYNIINQVTDYIDLLFSFGFLQLIMRPTRCTHHSATLIDHIVTNNTDGVYESVIMINRISDHFPIFYFSSSDKICSKIKLVQYRDFSIPNINKFSANLRAIGWNDLGAATDPQVAYDHFADLFFSLYDIQFPVLSKRLCKNTHSLNPWMTKGLLISRSKKIQLCKLSVKSPSPLNLANFKTYRNIYSKLIRTSKKLYYEKALTKYQSNIKKTWQILRKAINKSSNKDCSIQNIILDGNCISDPALMAEKFNVFFANIANNIVSSINPSNTIPDPNPNVCENLFSLSDSPVTASEIVECAKMLNDKKTQDFNGLSSSFIKKIIMSIATPLKHIFNLSFNTGLIPHQLKTAKVIPLFKSGDRTCMDNYRPIALLSVFSKILEKIVFTRLSIFLENNDILSKFQFGFRKDHSTVHPMLHFINHITNALEKKEHTIAIFCDLRKAFDSCNHEILLKKLDKIGIQNVNLLWFKNYLTNRLQFVSLDNFNSKLLNINIGVPQGSILGPLLFLIYINDLPYCSSFLTLLFADDTTLLLSHSSIHELIILVNRELQKVVNFFRFNNLSLHPLKTKFLVFSNSNLVKQMDISININNNNNDEENPSLIFPVERVKQEDDIPAVRFLGVFFDPNLSFSYHIKLLKAKLAKALFIMRASKNILTLKARKAIYYSLFHCNLIYCLPIWSCTSQNLLKPITLMQKAAVRIINNSRYNDHTEPIFKCLSILPLHKLVLFFNLQLMQRFKQGFLPVLFNSTWATNNFRRNENYEISLRNENDFNIPFARLASSDKRPLINLPKTWEDFHEESIKIIRNRPEFNIKLKFFFLNELSSIPNCNRLLCHVCHLQNIQIHG